MRRGSRGGRGGWVNVVELAGIDLNFLDKG